MSRTLTYVVITISLIIGGFFAYRYFIELSLSQIDMTGVQLTGSTVSAQLRSNLIFALYIGAIPFIFRGVLVVSNVKKRHHALICLGIILASGIVSWQIRLVEIKNRIEALNQIYFNHEFKNFIDVQSLNFEKYLLLGFIIGGILCILMFRGKKKLIDDKP